MACNVLECFFQLQYVLDDALRVLHDHVKTLEDGINPFHTEQSPIIPSPEDYPLPDSLPDSLPVSKIIHALLITYLHQCAFFSSLHQIL